MVIIASILSGCASLNHLASQREEKQIPSKKVYNLPSRNGENFFYEEYEYIISVSMSPLPAISNEGAWKREIHIYKGSPNREKQEIAEFMIERKTDFVEVLQVKWSPTQEEFIIFEPVSGKVLKVFNLLGEDITEKFLKKGNKFSTPYRNIHSVAPYSNKDFFYEEYEYVQIIDRKLSTWKRELSIYRGTPDGVKEKIGEFTLGKGGAPVEQLIVMYSKEQKEIQIIPIRPNETKEILKRFKVDNTSQ